MVKKAFLEELASIFKKLVEKLGWQLLVGISLSIGTLILFGWIADEVFEGEFSTFDSTIRDGLQTFANPVLTGIMIFFTYLGSVYGVIGMLIAALLLFYRFDHKRAIALLTITMSGEALLGIVLKLSFQRPRPEAFFGFTPPTSYSFPSGHAFASLCFFGALALIVTARLKSRLQKSLVWITAAFFILSIGGSRIYLGVHYPSDILAGYLAGIVWLSAVYSADHRLLNRKK